MKRRGELAEDIERLTRLAYPDTAEPMIAVPVKGSVYRLLTRGRYGCCMCGNGQTSRDCIGGQKMCLL